VESILWENPPAYVHINLHVNQDVPQSHNHTALLGQGRKDSRARQGDKRYQCATDFMQGQLTGLISLLICITKAVKGPAEASVHQNSYTSNKMFSSPLPTDALPPDTLVQVEGGRSESGSETERAAHNAGRSAKEAIADGKPDKIPAAAFQKHPREGSVCQYTAHEEHAKKTSFQKEKLTQAWDTCKSEEGWVPQALLLGHWKKRGKQQLEHSRTSTRAWHLVL